MKQNKFNLSDIMDAALVNEKAVSKSQQNLFGIAHAIQKGEIPASNTPAGKIAKTVSKKDVKDFASTDTKNLPTKKKTESVNRNNLSQLVSYKNKKYYVSKFEYDNSKLDGITLFKDKNLKIPTNILVNKETIKPVDESKIKKLKEFKMKKSELKQLVKEELKTIAEQQSEQLPPMSIEEKKEFLENIKKFDTYGKHIYTEVDLVELSEQLSNLCKIAERVTLEETDGWFDKITVNRNMKELHRISEEFTKTAKEAKSVQERMRSLYEDMGTTLSRYFEVKNKEEVPEEPIVSEEESGPSKSERQQISGQLKKLKGTLKNKNEHSLAVGNWNVNLKRDPKTGQWGRSFSKKSN